MVLTYLQMTDVIHQVTHHQHNHVYVPRRNLLGSKCECIKGLLGFADTCLQTAKRTCSAQAVGD